MNEQQREQVLKDAITKAEAEGIAVVSGNIGSRKAGCACAIGCVVLDDDGGDHARYAHAAEQLGLTHDQVWALARGFDDALELSRHPGSHYVRARDDDQYRLGLRVGVWFVNRSAPPAEPAS